MNLSKIQPAIASILARPRVTELRSHTYMATYPVMMAIGAAPAVSHAVKFHQLATMVYGWMPRVLRIDPIHIGGAINAMCAAMEATPRTFSTVPIQDIAKCLHSVVGASKLLHFVNPHAFPIWDSKIESFRSPASSDMTDVAEYLKYARNVHDIRSDPDFPAFYAAFQSAYSSRLRASGIPAYHVNEVRAIEAAAFELAP